MRRERPKAFGTRYDQRKIGINVERMCKVRGKERKWAYDLLGIKKGEYSRKVNGETPFTLWEASVLADALDAPPGWPFIDAELGEQLRRSAAQPEQLATPALAPTLRAAESPPPYVTAPAKKSTKKPHPK